MHILHRIKAVDCQPLESLKDLLTKEVYEKYTNNLHIGKTWFKLTTNVFVAFLFQVLFLLHHPIHAMLGFICPTQEGSYLAILCESILMLASLSSLVARDYRGLK